MLAGWGRACPGSRQLSPSWDKEYTCFCITFSLSCPDSQTCCLKTKIRVYLSDWNGDMIFTCTKKNGILKKTNKTLVSGILKSTYEHSHYCPDGPAVYLLKLHYEFLIMSYYADVQSGLHKSLNTKMLHPPGSDISIRHARTAVTAASLCNKDMKGSRWGFERELQNGKFHCFSHCKAQMDSITVYIFFECLVPFAFI